MKPYNRDRSTKVEEIREMFDRIAPNYDMLNHTLSFNIDRIWRARMIRTVTKEAPRQLLDLATGTGDVAISIARKIPNTKVLAVDLSEGMLSLARQKSTAAGTSAQINFVQGSAETLSSVEGVAQGSFDAVTLAFGIRNFEDVEAGLRESALALRDGGQLVILELSTPRNPIMRAFHKIYSHKLLPFIASLAARSERSAYEYLPASVDHFHTPEQLLELMRTAGFSKCCKRSQTFGLAHIYIGIKEPNTQ